MRLVLDTNVIVAGIAYPAGPPGRIVAAWRNGSLQVVLSPWILEECERVLPRLRQFTSMPPADIRDLVDSLAFAAEIVEPDPVALARAADAQVRDAADEPSWQPCWRQRRRCWSPATRTFLRFRTGIRSCRRRASARAMRLEPEPARSRASRSNSA